MAKVPGKGSVMKWDMATVLTAIAQVNSIDHDGAEEMTFDATSLDSGAGKEYQATGYSEGGSVSCELFLDPVNTGIQSITDQITTPTVLVANQIAASVTLADAATTEYAFTVAGVSFGFSVAQDDGVKANVSLKLTGLVTYPT